MILCAVTEQLSFLGIYPREPRNKKKASKTSTPSTTFYYTKDIQYLLHEPLLRKFREHKTLSKKISKALGRGEVTDAARLEKNFKPRLSLDHIIKERYPTFVDALRDLDDALSMLFLFANLPSTTTIPPKTIALCQRLCLEFQHYLIVSHSLKKSFLSIKGIYYQATIHGQDILWLVPYRFVQRVTDDVDFRIMGTFVEFYTTLLGFVNFKLYTSIGLVYPPQFNPASDEKGGELRALVLQGKPVDGPQQKGLPANLSLDEANTGTNSHTDADANGHVEVQAQPTDHLDLVIQRIATAEQKSDDPNPEQSLEDNYAQDDIIDIFDTPISADADILPQPSLSSWTSSSLFGTLTVFLSRETPRQPLEFLLRAFGCKRIGWSMVLGDGAFTNDEADMRITHQIVDRPSLPMGIIPTTGSDVNMEEETPIATSAPSRTVFPGRTYVQPQWVWDCVNAGELLRPNLYVPGAELPPHLSPWVKPSKGQYDPTIPLAEQEQEGEAEAEEAEGEDEEEKLEEEEAEERREALSNEKLEPSKARESKILDAREAADDHGGMDVANWELSEEDNDQQSDTLDEKWEGFEDEPAALSDDEDGVNQRELEAEVAGVPVSAVAKPRSKSELRLKSAATKRRAEQEELERQKMMMSRKKRKMLDKMLYSNQQKDEKAATLRQKRRKLEKVKDGRS